MESSPAGAGSSASPDALADAIRGVLAPEAGQGAASADIATRASRAGELLSTHLSRLVGDIGMRTLVRRSLVLAQARHAWLASAVPMAPAGVDTGSDWSVLRAVMERQEPAAAVEGFVAALSTLIGLLQRLIGDPLVRRLLHELWPVNFPLGAEEPT